MKRIFAESFLRQGSAAREPTSRSSGEAIRILKNRHCFNAAALRRHLDEYELFVAVPDEATPKWMHEVALSIADEFSHQPQFDTAN